MRSSTVFLMLIIFNSACSMHATYGRPAPRDSIPSTQEPTKQQAPEDGTIQRRSHSLARACSRQAGPGPELRSSC